MTQVSDVLLERVLLLDGGMGTQILAHRPTVDDFGGASYEGCMELLNERRPEWIRSIHAAYFDAGADAVETNTFGCNAVVLAEFGLAHRVEDLNLQAVRLARQVAAQYDRQRYVIGSVGPGTKLVSLGHITPQALFESYRIQMRGLIRGGADAILIETSQDLGQIKAAVRAARAAMVELGVAVPLWVQMTVETTGTLLLGSEVQAVLTAVEPLGIQVLGLNCGTGPDEMHGPLQTLGEASPLALSCLPNAGLPVNQGGQLVYPMTPDAFAEKVLCHAQTFGLNVIGGCCGTTPDHIRALSGRLGSLAVPTSRKPLVDRAASSLYVSVNLHQDPAPLIVGERTNANGSKAFRDLLAKEDWDGLVGVARGQQREGAHMLDVCVAYVGRDEVADMTAFVQRLVTQTTLPLMIDSTEPPAIEAALQLAPGRCVVNSINFEDGDAKARSILNLCRTYGAAVVGLTIDESGMAKTCSHKLAIAERLYRLVVEEYGFDPGDLIIDPLTFTLGSGEEGFRKAAVETLEAVRGIKDRWPQVKTLLGVSNISFGLAPSTRHVVNALMLYHAVKAGLDLAIFNASKVIPVARIEPEERTWAEDLLFDRRREGYDPLKQLLERTSRTASADSVSDAPCSIEERLQRDIIDGEKTRIPADLDVALKTYDPLTIINTLLLEGMKTVGARFGAGEMQLPFVLESAEAMKAAIAHLQPFMPKESTQSKGRIILATVKGDVHDIGKNLVDIILSNNGYTVKNLGIKQPIESVRAALDAWPADAIGLSGLLVKSTVIMRENLAHLAALGRSTPVILGGAALTRDYVDTECQKVFTTGTVVYAEDAFEGLRIMDRLVQGLPLREGPVPLDSGSTIQVLHRGTSQVTLTEAGRSSWIRAMDAAPNPPFWGIRTVEASLEDLEAFLDDFVVVRNRWSFTQGSLSDEAFDAVLREQAEPKLAAWKARLRSEGRLQPKGCYGYFPVVSDGDVLRVFHPQEPTSELGRWQFPRQSGGRRQCIADFFAPADAPFRDVLALQVVTLGDDVATWTAELFAQDQYADYFFLHGLATELTEAFAEFLHARIRRELGIHGKDAAEKRRLFSQGYQGSRYSFGYPACPDLEGNGLILDLLQAEALGVRLSETFQMVPEFSTSALIAWHPQARYFSV